MIFFIIRRQQAAWAGRAVREAFGRDRAGVEGKSGRERKFRDRGHAGKETGSGGKISVAKATGSLGAGKGWRFTLGVNGREEEVVRQTFRRENVPIGVLKSDRERGGFLRCREPRGGDKREPGRRGSMKLETADGLPAGHVEPEEKGRANVRYPFGGGPSPTNREPGSTSYSASTHRPRAPKRSLTHGIRPQGDLNCFFNGASKEKTTTTAWESSESGRTGDREETGPARDSLQGAKEADTRARQQRRNHHGERGRERRQESQGTANRMCRPRGLADSRARCQR